MRLFIALPVPPGACRALSAAQRQLSAVAAGGRYVPAENFHITMHFIGESQDLLGAAQACDDAVRGIRPFLLRLVGFGRFLRGQSYTGYIAAGGDLAELRALHEALCAALRTQGFSLSGAQKRLTPHITLARELTPPQTEDLFSSLALDAGADAAFTVSKLVLFESRRIKDDMVYTPLHSSNL